MHTSSSANNPSGARLRPGPHGPTGFHPGDHVFFPYRSAEDRDASLASYFGDGLVAGERCAYAGLADSLTAVANRLAAAGFDVAAEARRGALVLVSSRAAYRPEGAFDPDRAIRMLDGAIDRAVSEGFTGLRGAGEFDFPVTGPHRHAAHCYEARLNDAFTGRPFTALCLYGAVDASPGATLDMLHSHPSAFIDGALRENPFYEAASLGPLCPPLLQDGTVGLSRASTRAVRAELQDLRQSLRSGTSPAADELLARIERVWSELRRLTP